MSKITVLLGTALIFFSSLASGQQENTAAASRFENIKKLLDYRYKGGFFTFEKDFLEQVKYPDEARKNCVIGIVIASFYVDCDGNYNPMKTRLKNPLHFGIEQEISKFLNSTQGHWNICHDKKYTRFEIPIQFTMEGTVTNEDDAAIVLEGKNPGYACTSDSVYLQRAIKYLKKNKMKKAAKNLGILIQRNPYNNEYYEMLKKTINRKKAKKEKK
jgi:hypothetical protein